MFKAAVIVTINNEYPLTENFVTNMLSLLPNIYQLVMVADGPTDVLTYRYLQKLHNEKKNVKVHFLMENKGFSAANNVAVRLTEAEYLIFVNSDTFPEKGSLEQLIAYLEQHKDVGVVQGMIISPQNNKVQSTGHIFAFYKTSHAFDGRDVEDPLVNQVYERQALASGFYAVSHTLFEKFNGFDEFYYNAWEGLEFSLKVHLSGMKCVYIPTARAYHVKGSGRNRLFRDETYQSAYFWSKWADKIHMDINQIFKDQLIALALSSSYFGINASAYRNNIWEKIIENLPITCYGFYNITHAIGNDRVSFEDSIPASIINSANNILFVADHFSTILNNSHFFHFRNKVRDVILDMHGNVICPQDYYQNRGSK